MKRNFALTALLAISFAANSEEIKYEKVTEANSARVGNIVARYLMLDDDSCLTLQILRPKDWGVITTSRLCEFEGLAFSTEFADAGFENISFSNEGVNFTLRLAPLRSAEETRKKCIVPVKGEKLEPMKCTDSKE